MHQKLGGVMQGVNRRRRYTVLTLAVMALCLLTGARSAFAADGDPFLDQCFAASVPLSGCTPNPGQLAPGAIALHPNKPWVYVAASTGSTPRIAIFDRGARG